MKDTIRNLCRTDLFFLLWFGLRRRDIARPWLMERCHEVQSKPDEHLDLWAREHYKSTIITFGLTIQNILASHGNDPLPEWEGKEPTFGIFSHTRPIAKGFLRQIKREFEENDMLKYWFDDILYASPKAEAPKWSEDDGIIVKRKGNPKESTVEAWGLVDGQPTSRHFTGLIYDDVVTVESVNTPDMIKKTTERLELSYALGQDGGFRRITGTRYHFNDTYKTVLDRQSAIPRIYPAIKSGVPALMSQEVLDKKRRDMGPYTYSCQMLLDPVADKSQGFRREWLKFYQDAQDGKGMNIYLLCDPAHEKKRDSDYTAMGVIGMAEDHNYYLLEAYRDRLNLTQRTNLLMNLHRKWKPLEIGYEKYGKDSDISHIEGEQERQNYRFDITPVGGQTSKIDRIKRLVPVCEQGHLYLPETQHRTLYDGKTVDIINVFIEEEYLAFPVAIHDDMLDMMSRIFDLEKKEWPGKNVFKPMPGGSRPTSWQGV